MLGMEHTWIAHPRWSDWNPGNLESRSKLWVLCCIPQAFPEPFLWCDRVHCPAVGGGTAIGVCHCYGRVYLVHNGVLVSEGLQMNVRTQGFPAGYCIVMRWWMLFTSPVIGFNVVADWGLSKYLFIWLLWQPKVLYQKIWCQLNSEKAWDSSFNCNLYDVLEVQNPLQTKWMDRVICAGCRKGTFNNSAHHRKWWALWCLTFEVSAFLSFVLSMAPYYYYCYRSYLDYCSCIKL